MSKKIKVLVVEPQGVPEVKEIKNDLRTMQSLVGGLIQPIYPFDEPVALVCNEEGKIDGLSGPNRLIDFGNGYRDIIFGKFFICAVPPGTGEFESLTDEQISRYSEKFRYPELFFRDNGGRLVRAVLFDSDNFMIEEI